MRTYLAKRNGFDVYKWRTNKHEAWDSNGVCVHVTTNEFDMFAWCDAQ